MCSLPNSYSHSHKPWARMLAATVVFAGALSASNAWAQCHKHRPVVPQTLPSYPTYPVPSYSVPTPQYYPAPAAPTWTAPMPVYPPAVAPQPAAPAEQQAVAVSQQTTITPTAVDRELLVLLLQLMVREQLQPGVPAPAGLPAPQPQLAPQPGLGSAPPAAASGAQQQMLRALLQQALSQSAVGSQGQ